MLITKRYNNVRPVKTNKRDKRLEVSKWRRGRDSNPRYALAYGSLAGNWFKPLTHLSEIRPGLLYGAREVLQEKNNLRFLSVFFVHANY